MTAEGWGFVAAVAIPLAVVVLAVVWPERVARDAARDNSVQGILNRVERERLQRVRRPDYLGGAHGGLGSDVTDRLPRLRPGDASRARYGREIPPRGPSRARRGDLFGGPRRNP